MAPTPTPSLHSNGNGNEEAPEDHDRDPDTSASQALPCTPSTPQGSAVLVAGGAGFLGRHLCRRLLEQGHFVVCMDNLFTSELATLELLRQDFPQQFAFVQHDITQPLPAWLTATPMQSIFNLACPASPVHYQFDPIQTIKTSCVGSLHLLELAERFHATIFQASTSEVYGDPAVVPQSEAYWGHVNCTGVRACYDEGKRLAETLFLEYARTRHVQVRIARIFNTYGPGMHPFDGRVVCNFILQALKQQDITIYGDGQQTRAFCYVDDLIDGILQLMACSTTGAEPVNLGNPEEITIADLAARIVQLTASKSRVVFKDLPLDDPQRRKPDISRAINHLGWRPQIGIDEGLQQTIAYFRTLDVEKYTRPINHSAHVNSSRIFQDTQRKPENDGMSERLARQLEHLDVMFE